MMTKKEIRKMVNERRKALLPEEERENSRKIYE